MSGRCDILKEYKRLVDEYYDADNLFEKVQYSEDEEEFDNHWRRVFKAHEHMINFRDKHKITTGEVVEYLSGGEE